ncbi:MAG: 50S ribosomal protein L9 [Halothiobacillus sp. 24-54-40]|jgi:large subunit ribosomal protein L9|nr:50S ribosomal protein L9 [Halothiobacillaceae bacterium]OYV46275.1 MAG: 50S ribosomal protein L9 [Halothiobacillus sp. 20-53-49]OYY41951.1 MAG: 50S ribosomal protein L9 [Halothiobacillus sp. 35-54-62]OYZ87595.1 MAG: 50S ribosomal protein L9 [Halothiobacillus sp. 24-54-40]OZA81205.1 MAG: 50S ribosomal protein L9 [Halothiobacillus sp. 39-53-45]HQS02438.1 50S ribosomal protein L9 [Halothiobacillus sp.]
MQVILLNKVENLGTLGDVVNVRAGYARNFLIPYGKATAATKANLAEFDARRAELERQANENMAAAVAQATQLAQAAVTIAVKAGAEGKLFGSVGTAEIAEAVTRVHGVVIEKRQVRLPAGALRAIGEFDVTLHLHTDVDAVIKVIVIGEE